MSGRKKLPDLTKLRPPYPDYVDLFFTGDDGKVTLNVNDPQHGFRHDAKGFALINAWWLAEACGLVYDNLLAVERRFKAAGMDSVELFDSGDEVDTQCFVASNKDFAIVAFRGTESDHRVGEDFDYEHVFNDIQADSQFKPVAFGGAGGMVHTGFKKSVDAVWPRLAARLSELNPGGRTFWFTGHSLGALSRVANFFGSLARRAFDFFNSSAPPKVRFVPGLLQDHVPLFYATHIWNAHVKE